MVTVGIVEICIHTIDKSVVETPYASLTIAYGSEVGRSKGSAEVEVGIFAVEVPLLACELHDTLGIEHLGVFVLQELRILLWLAWQAMALSGMRTATQLAPLTPGPLPIISRIQISLGSAMEKLSPSLTYPYFSTREVITCIASRAVLAR